MGTLTAVHEEIKTALIAAGVDADYGPRTDTTVRGVTIWPTAGLEVYDRACGSPSARADRVQVTCYGPTILDSLAVAAKVRHALRGRALTASGASGGRLREDGFSGVEPTAETDADPQRVSYPLAFTIITKGI